MPGLVFLVPLLTACGDSKYAQAGVGAGIAVAAVGVHRAITGGCWGQCPSGYVCNHDTGVCEIGECMPPCAVGSHCARASHGALLCEPDPTTMHFGAAQATRPAATADGGVSAGGRAEGGVGRPPD